MPAEHPDAVMGDDPVDEILAAYLKAVEAGLSPERQELVARHPEMADDLAAFFAAHDQFEQLAAPLRAVRSTSASACSSETVDHPDLTGSYPPRPESGRAPALPGVCAIPGYEILGVLGQGGMGTVYQARQLRLDRIVALKVIRLDRFDAPGYLERFSREMRVVGQLDHPHLVEAHDAGEHNGVLYLAMKLIDGIDLGALVRQAGALSVLEACSLVRQAALALQYLHERGLVHRDIKPSNLKRTSDGQLKILDLGLARWLEAVPCGPQTESGTMLGSMDFMAPEQADDPSAADIRADLYSLGATLFFLLTGKAPFAHHGSMPAKLKAHAVEAPADVRTIRVEVPAEVADLVRRLLAKNPADRPATPQLLADDLAQILDGATGQGATKAIASQPPRPFLKRRPVRIVGALGLLGLAAIATWVLLPRLGFTGRDPNRDDPDGKHGGVLGDRQVERIQILRLEVNHYARVGKFEPPRGRLGERSFSTNLGDAVTVSSRLSAPAYCYLIAYRPDGTDELCFPEEEETPPTPHLEPKYPSVSAAKRYGLDEGAGLMAFVLVASREKLPAYAQWRKERGKPPWRKVEALPDVIWRFDGVTLWAVTQDDPEGVRGKGRKVKEVEPLVDLLDWLRKEERFETVAAVAFPVLEGK